MRAPLILERLGELYPEATCSLDWRTPYELLVATMLSAQCTDARVNQVAPALFAAYPTAEDLAMAAAPQNTTRAAARSTGAFPSIAPTAPSSTRPTRVTATVTQMRAACP